MPTKKTKVNNKHIWPCAFGDDGWCNVMIWKLGPTSIMMQSRQMTSIHMQFKTKIFLFFRTLIVFKNSNTPVRYVGIVSLEFQYTAKNLISCLYKVILTFGPAK